jgi:acetylornithine deacetylase/succinyl-diaminopimelate desuccinylase-like protein
VFDPVVHGPPRPHLGAAPRPNLIIDHDVGAEERVLILAHYDVVPVPSEQLARWKSPPFSLTQRSDGRLYGRGANDDLGSGVVASVLALKRVVAEGTARRNVRLIVCCDEETGGEGGVESLKAHDDALPVNDPGRFLLGDVALIPDGSPHATAASSGVAFLDASFDGPVPLAEALAFGESLVGLHTIAAAWTSVYPSPDWPDHLAPDPHLTGRATVTQFDLTAPPPPTGASGLLGVHAESDAANQIAESVTLAFAAPTPAATELDRALGEAVRAPFRVEPAHATGLPHPPGAVLRQIVGLSAHGGYPHRGHNPVPAALEALGALVRQGRLAPDLPVTATYSVDLRLIPEMPLAEGIAAAEQYIAHWAQSHQSSARVVAPPARCRGGYALAMDHPAVRRLEQLLDSEGAEAGIFGEYGGTDASTLATVRTSRGYALPAIVFGSMDRQAHIHEAEESVDPRLLGAVVRTITRFLTEP